MAPAPGVAEEFRQSRRVTDELFDLIAPGALYERPIPERHRLIFYLGHLEAFDWNLIGRYSQSAESFHPTFDRLFAFGIDPDSSGLPQDKANDWPGESEIREYNGKVRQTLDRLVTEVPEQLLHVAIEHRLMHAETFAYLLHALPYEQKRLQADTGSPSFSKTGEVWINIPAGRCRMGLAGDGFGWDNEFQPHEVDVPAFEITKYKITNAQYLEFMRQTGAASPHFWSDRHGAWFYRGMFEEIPLPPEAPVYVTQEQAQMYAWYAGGELPTEAQWHRAAEGARAEGNLDFRHWDPVTVSATPEGDSRWGVSQLTGNGWEWTSTIFHPFPGFEPFPFYKGYSADFFDGKHYVMKGASPRTAARLARPSFRNWFRPGYPYMYGTFRVVKNPR